MTPQDFLSTIKEYKSNQILLKQFADSLLLMPRDHVFSNADTSLQHIKHYGFDYDYTLATYNRNLPDLIYNLAKKRLVEDLGYPSALHDRKYDHNFAIRGLHLDKETGLLMKLDQYNKIQLPIYRGTAPVTTAETVKTYGGLRVSKSYARHSMHMLKDLFALPMACLYAHVVDIITKSGVQFVASHVVEDVNQAIEETHGTEAMHKTIAKDPKMYLNPNPSLVKYLERIHKSGRTSFLLTNSPFYFVDAGMTELVGRSDWNKLFDVVIVRANKPYFYQAKNKFRKVNRDGSLSVEPVDFFERGEIYTGGGLEEFNRLTGYVESNVIYMGDQIYSDLVEPQRATQWKTAAIIKELGPEIEQMNCPSFRSDLTKLMFVEKLLAEGQIFPECEEKIEWLKTERSHIRTHLKHTINPYFGSIFRTSNSRTAFFYNVGRYADIYTSSVNNFLDFPMDYCFYTSRESYPHEAPMNNVDDMMDSCIGMARSSDI